MRRCNGQALIPNCVLCEQVTLFGVGRLGICTGLCLEKAGYNVLGVDVNQRYVSRYPLSKLHDSTALCYGPQGRCERFAPNMLVLLFRRTACCCFERCLPVLCKPLPYKVVY